MQACSPTLVLQCILGVLGAAAALHAAYRVKRAADAIDSFPLRLLAAGLAVFAAALLLDALSPLAAPVGRMHPRWAGERRPEQVTFIHVNHVSMLGQPLYMVAYTLYAAAVYGSHVEDREATEPAAERLPAAIPLVAMLYMDYNIAAFLLLAAAGYTVLTRGGAGPRWLLFYATLAASHVAAAVAVYATSSTLLTAAVAARALAPILLYLPEPG